MMNWSKGAEQAITRVPFFVRSKVKKRVEETARQDGAQEVCLHHVLACQQKFLRNMEDNEVKGFQVEGCFNDARKELQREVSIAKRVYIDEKECIGCQSRVQICPEVFACDEEKEKAKVIKPEGGPEELVQEAIDTCPVECIHWEE